VSYEERRIARVALIVLKGIGIGQKHLEEYTQRIAYSLRRQGVDIVEQAKSITTRGEYAEAVHRAEEQAVDCIIIVPGAFVKSMNFIEPRPKVPVLIWSPYESATLSIASALELGALMSRRGIKCNMLVGSPEETRVISQALSFIRACRAMNRTSKMRIGVVVRGGLVTHDLRFGDVASTFAMELIPIETDLLEEYVKEIDKVNTLVKERIVDRMGVIEVPLQLIHEEAKLYMALKNIIKARSLDGIHVLAEACGHASFCIALALLDEEGYLATCGSLGILVVGCLVKAMLDMSIARAIIAGVEREEKILKLINCGYMPLSMAYDLRDIDLCRQRTEVVREGVSMRFCCRHGRVNIVKLYRIDKGMKIVIASGSSIMVPKERFREDVEVWPHAFVKLDGDLGALLSEIPDGEVALMLSDRRRDWREIARLYDMEYSIIQ